MALTPTQQALALSAFAQGMGPLDLATRMGVDYSDVYLFLQNQKKEALRRGFDPIPTMGAPFDLSSSGGLVSTDNTIKITPSGLNVNLQSGSAIPIIQAEFDASSTRAPQFVSYTATRTTMYAVSVFLESEGDGLFTDTLIGTLTFQEDDPTDVHTFVCTLHGGPGESIVMETYPVLVEVGTVISFSTAFSAGVFTYDVGIRLVQMP